MNEVVEVNGNIAIIENEENLTKLNEYSPTSAELRLLQVLLDPNFVGKSVVDKCKAANCTTPIYYAAIKKPGFNEMCKQTAIDLIKAEVLPLIQSGLREAKRGSFQHWKVLLEMAGLYSEKSEVNNIHTIGLEQSLLDMIKRKNQD
jgi:hypothetical protein